MKWFILFFLIHSSASAIEIESCYEESPKTIEAIQDAILEQSERGSLSSSKYELLMREIKKATTCDHAVALSIDYLAK